MCVRNADKRLYISPKKKMIERETDREVIAKALSDLEVCGIQGKLAHAVNLLEAKNNKTKRTTITDLMENSFYNYFYRTLIIDPSKSKKFIIQDNFGNCLLPKFLIVDSKQGDVLCVCDSVAEPKKMVIVHL